MKFHRDAMGIPTDIKEKKKLIEWLEKHPAFSHPHTFRRSGGAIDELLPPGGQEEYTSEIHCFYECLDIMHAYVNPETRTVSDNDEENTQFEVWLEIGPMYDMSENEYTKDTPPEEGWNEFNKWTASHDISLDCGGNTLEEALLTLATKVKFFYGDTKDGSDVSPPSKCKSYFLEEEYIRTCESGSDGYCVKCGYRVDDD